MIYMSINTHNYENDVRVMTGAFYPGEKIVTDSTDECGIKVEIIVEGGHITGSITKDAEIYMIDVVSENESQGSVRNLLKRELYHVFSKITGKKLPWGTLTGIRPVKIPLALIEQGYDDKYIYEHFKSEYLVDDTKAKLGLQVAHNEHVLLSDLDYKTVVYQ